MTDHPNPDVWVPLGDAEHRERLAARADELQSVMDRLLDDHPMYAQTKRQIDEWRRGYRRRDSWDEADDEEGRR